MKAMKLYLDDERPTPDGWERAYTAPEAIAMLETGKVTHLSLDHDLGPEGAGTGYDVCLFVEQTVGRQRMEFAIQLIYHHFKVTQPVAWESFREGL